VAWNDLGTGSLKKIAERQEATSRRKWKKKKKSTPATLRLPNVVGDASAAAVQRLQDNEMVTPVVNRKGSKRKRSEEEHEDEEEENEVSDMETQVDYFLIAEDDHRDQGAKVVGRALEKGARRSTYAAVRLFGRKFSLGDVVYVNGNEDDPLVASIERIYIPNTRGAKKTIMVRLQWYYRYSDLPKDCGGFPRRSSKLSKERELWKSNLFDNNPIGTVIGRLNVKHLQPKKKAVMAKGHCHGSEHNYYCVNEYDARAYTIVNQ